MKKKSLLILGLVAMLGLGVASCKKDCHCVGKYNGVTVSDVSEKTKKKDCKGSYTSSYMGQTVTVNCTWGN